MWCWRRMEVSWTDRVKNGKLLHRGKDERNCLHTIKRGTANWIAHILRRNCLVQGVIKRNVCVTGRRGRRYKHLLDDLKETSVSWKLKGEAQDRTVWKLTTEEAVVRQIS
jgi:hypothetical protein